LGNLLDHWLVRVREITVNKTEGKLHLRPFFYIAKVGVADFVSVLIQLQREQKY
jgi:hypothetical protein